MFGWTLSRHLCVQLPDHQAHLTYGQPLGGWLVPFASPHIMVIRYLVIWYLVMCGATSLARPSSRLQLSIDIRRRQRTCVCTAAGGQRRSHQLVGEALKLNLEFLHSPIPRAPRRDSVQARQRDRNNSLQFTRKGLQTEYVPR